MRKGNRIAVLVTLALVGCRSADKQLRPALPLKPVVAPGAATGKTDGAAARLNNSTRGAKPLSDVPLTPQPEKPTFAASTVTLPTPKPIAMEPLPPLMPAAAPPQASILPAPQPGTIEATVPPIADVPGTIVMPSLTVPK